MMIWPCVFPKEETMSGESPFREAAEQASRPAEMTIQSVMEELCELSTKAREYYGSDDVGAAAATLILARAIIVVGQEVVRELRALRER